MHKNREKLLEGPILSSLLFLAVPIVLANVLQTMYQLIDMYWVGHLGSSAVAAVSISGPFTFLLIALGAGIAVAGSTLIAQYIGAHNDAMVNHIAAQTFLMVLVVSSILGIIGYIATPSILTLLNVSPDVYPGARDFMRLSFIGVIFTFGFAVFQSIMRGTGDAYTPLYIVLATVILNFFLAPVFIFGWGPFDAHGVAGAGMAMLLTQGLALLTGLVILFTGRYGIHLSAKDFVPDGAFMKRAFALGFPASIEQSARALGMVMMMFLITSFGTAATAAFGVGSNMLRIVVIPAMGLSMAISTLVGQNIGARNIIRAENIARLGAKLSFFGLTAIGVIAFICAKQVVVFFIPNEPEVIEIGTTFIRLASLSFGFMGLQMALTGVLRAAGDTFAVMVIVLVFQWVIQFPLAYILSRHTELGITGVWISFPVSYILVALITAYWYKKGTWKQKRLTEEDTRIEKVTEEILIEEGVS